MPGDNSAVLAWDLPLEDEATALTGYEATVYSIEDPADTQKATFAASALAATITGLRNGRVYQVLLKAQNAVGLSAPTEAVEVRPTNGIDGEVSRLVVEYEPGVASVEAPLVATGSDVIDEVGLEPGKALGDGLMTVELTEPVSIAEAEAIAEVLTADPRIASAEPDQVVTTAAFPDTTPNDAQFAGQQWNLWDTYGIGAADTPTDMTNAYSTAQGAGVRVAVIDTGITRHEDFGSRLLPGYDFVSSYPELEAAREAVAIGSDAAPAAVSFDGDYVATGTYGDLGWDANPADPGDWRGVAPVRNSSWHGTNIAGIVGAEANNAIGIVGVAPKVEIQPIRALSWRGGLLSDVAASITWASGGVVPEVAENPTPANVINLSFSTEGMCTPALQTAIDGALSRGVTVVAAAGNANDDVSKYAPANCDGVISVGASDRNGKRAGYSNYGAGIDLAAPGGDANGDGSAGVYTLSNTGAQAPLIDGYAYTQGTSVSAAHVTGALARLIELSPRSSPSELRFTLTGAGNFKHFAQDSCDIDPLKTCGPGIVQIASSAMTNTFSYTGAVQTWVVPAGITEVYVQAIGAAGGSGGRTVGSGARVQGTLAVTPGETLNIYVGGGGVSGSGGATGGWNGGGNGQGTLGGGGGGASDIRQGGTAAANRVIVAGGGGGAGNYGVGGGAGYPSSSAGQLCTSAMASCANNGTVATQSVGGASGIGGNTAGSNAGGGGGGYYGGGGSTSTNASAPGGSSYTSAVVVSSVTHTAGVNTSSSANGSIVITTTVPTLTPSDFVAAGFAKSVDLAWTSWNFDAVTGYRIKWGTDPASMTNQIDVNSPASTFRHQSQNVLAITNKVLTSNVATLTTSTAHGLAVGDVVVVEGVGSPFNGTMTVTTVPTTTTFKFAATSVNITSAAVNPTGIVQKQLSMPSGTTFYYKIAARYTDAAQSCTTNCFSAYTSPVVSAATVFANGTVFEYTGAPVAYTVPDGVSWLQVDTQGGQGGTAGLNGYSGGLGGRARATIPVTAGETLFVYVGGSGGGVTRTYDTSLSLPFTYSSGWNGGGTGNNSYAGGGGGASDIRRNEFTVTNRSLASNVVTLTTSVAHGFTAGGTVVVTGVDSAFNGTYTILAVPTTTTFTYAKTSSNVSSTASTGTVRGPSTPANATSLASRVVVAGGGGGAGYYANGGTGGGLIGGSSTGASGTTSYGGTQTSGNALGVGQSVLSASTSVNAGGGGGGYWGGDVSTGNNVGGGGGSSWARMTVLSATDLRTSSGFITDQGVRAGDGRVSISSPVTTTLAAPTNLTAYGEQRRISLNWTPSASDSVTGYRVLWGTTSGALDNSFDILEPNATGYVHSGPTVTAITNAALTSNVVTLTTSAAHGLTTGNDVRIQGLGFPYDGTFTVASTTSTTFTYARTASNIASAWVTGLAQRAALLTLGKTYYYQVAPIYTDLNQGCGRRCIGEATSEISALVRFTSASNFEYTGAPQIYTVPDGVTWLGVDLFGAQGGTAGANGYTGGRGGQVTGTIPVTPGETLYVYTGGSGGGVTVDYDGSRSASNTYDAGWNGGGTGNNSNAGGGGGASDIRRNEFTVTSKSLTSSIATLTTSLPHGFTVGAAIVVAGVDATFNGSFTVASVPSTTTFTYAKTASNVSSTASAGTVRGPSASTNTTSLASRVVVAGGGGGAGYWANGGAGGGLVGGTSSGASGTTSYGGTQTSGNALGVGKSVLSVGASTNAGGGGGGYWGGGVSTNNVGGGGGSSWASAAAVSSGDPRTASGIRHSQGVRESNGLITISAPDSGALRVPLNVQATGQLGQVALNWTVSPIDATTGYRLLWGTSLGAITNQIDISGAANTSYVHTGRAVGTTYYYQLAALYSDFSLACGSTCVSGYSTTVFATPIFTSDLVFEYSGAPVAYTVPQGVSWLQVDVQGGQGGTAGAFNYTGGLGGRTQATIPVTSGETLYVYTGGSGGGVSYNYDGSRAASNSYDPGWNGGGTGNNSNAGGGGGASDIRRNEFTLVSGSNVSGTVTLTTSAAHGIPVGSSIVVTGAGSPFDGTFTTITGSTGSTIKYTVTSTTAASASLGTVRGPSTSTNATSLASRAIVAGGGGGAGYYAGGGAGGGLVGGSSSGTSGTTSYGGTQTSGNALGVGKSVFGVGTSTNTGAGGGGYWGGGASTNNVGGGGGSSWTSPNGLTTSDPRTIAGVTQTQGYRSGDGIIRIGVPTRAYPTGVAAVGLQGFNAINWDEATTTGISAYKVYGGTSPDPTQLIATLPITSTTFSHGGATSVVTNRALVSNVATLTTSSPHGYTVGRTVLVQGVSASFDGTYTIASVPSTTTFTYTRVASNVTSAASTTGVISPADALTLGTRYYYYRVSFVASGVESEKSAEVSAIPVVTTNVSFEYSGAPVAYTVPQGVSWLQVDVQGGQGGTSGAFNYTGGLGGRTQATIPVTSGETLYVYTGGGGGGVSYNYDGSRAASNTYDPGWNGGGTGNNSNAGGGGGASDIRRNEFTLVSGSNVSGTVTLTTSAAHGFAIGSSIVVIGAGSPFDGTYTTITGTTGSTIKYTVTSTTAASASSGTVRGPSTSTNTTSLASRVVVAGGGGGAGYSANGGAGGGLVGGSSSGASGTTSYGGTQTSGNALGVGKGVLSAGGSVNAGGGGGGYWGGGVSVNNNVGGGGGSSFAPDQAAAVFLTQGFRSGDGLVGITVPLSTSASGLAAAAGDRQVALSWSSSASSSLVGYSILGGTTPNPTTEIATVSATESSFLHEGPSISVTTRQLTSNVATLTTSGAHGFVVGQSVKVSDISSVFNGTYVISAVTSTTFSYSKVNANITAASTIGTATLSTGLTNGTTYYYRVAPILLLNDVRTTAPYSSIVSATPTTLTSGTYSYTGAPLVFTVPAGVAWLQVDARAGQGGTSGAFGYAGGLGGRTQATIPVTAGETLYLYVGGAGGRAGSNTTANIYAGGWNGGGTGNNSNGGGGGGASDIRRNEFTVRNKSLTSNIATLTTSLAHGFAVGASVVVAGVDATFNGSFTVASVPSTTTFTYAKTASNVSSTASTGTVRGPSLWSNTASIESRAVIAGGGGGAGYSANGGAGGGLVGGSSSGASGTTSYGGTQTSGNALGVGKSVLGAGGSVNAGGGGGGYWGGGVSTGNNVGGGGASSWASDDSAAVIHTQAQRSGDGQIQLSYAVDNVGPAVANVSSTMADGPYRYGSVIPIQVNFNEPLVVTGTPQITMALGAGSARATVVLNYTGGSGSSTLSFDYTIAVGDLAPDLDYADSSALALNGGTITDRAGNVAILTLPAPGAADSLAANKELIIDANPPASPSLFVVDGADSILLDWSANSESDLKEYRVYSCSSLSSSSCSSLSNFSVLSSVTAPTSTFEHFAVGRGITYYYYVVAVDTRGNESGPSTILSWTLPVPTLVTTPSVTTATPTNDSTPTISGVADPGASVTIYIDGVAQSPSVTVAGDATYTYTPTTPLSSGDHTIKAIASVTVSRKTNSSSFSLDWTVTVDTTAPRLTSISRSSPTAATTSADTLVFRVLFDSVVSGVGTSDFAVSGTSATPTAVTAVSGVTGAYNVTVSGGNLAGYNGVVGLGLSGSPTIFDAAGNALVNLVAVGAVQSYTMDNNFPTVTVTSATPSVSAAATITFTLDKATTDFDIADISTTSGTMSAFVASSSTLYTATYTPASGFSGSATISVDAASFIDAGGLANSAGTLTLTVDTTPPTVTAITSTNVNGYYGAGAVIDVTVTFSELVNVLSAAGIPSLLLETGATDRAAAYLSGSGTNTLTFRYTVQAGDISADLDEQSASALAVNGGSIKDVAGNNATLTVPAPGAAGSLGANKAIIVDTVAPTAPTSLSAIGVGGTAVASRLNSTNTDLSASATIVAGEATGGSAQLLLGSTVIATDATISSGDTSIAFTLGTASAAALQALISTGGSLTVRVLDATGNVSTASAAVTLTVDYSSPSVTLASSRSSLINGQTATITATLSEASTTFASASATVSGGTLSSWSGSGTTYTATFTPTSASSGTASISYAMGSWTDLSSNPSNAATALTLPFDTSLPTVTSISSSTANGAYKAGAVIDVTVTFSEAVAVTTGTGTPTLLLETGTTDRLASYTSGSGSSTLNFRYTVQAGDSSADLNQQSAAALVLNGGVIADSAGNNATLTLPAITSGATGALATNAAIVIDTEAPSAPTTVAVIPVGGTVVANTLLASNTNMTSTASITAGQATGGYAELLLGSSVIATDLSISSGDSSVAFDLGLSGAAALQATIAASGNLTVRLYDAVGNVSAASAARSLTVDYIVPTVTVTSSRTAFTLGQTATVTFTLSEDSANFVAGDVTVVNGSISSFSGSGSSYSATFTPATGNGLVGSISVASGALTDAAGNSNSASNTVGLTIDTVAPAVSSFTSTTADGSYRLGQSINIRAVMTESVLAGSTMTVTLDTGATVTVTTATSSSILNGTYVVGSSQATNDLTVASYTYTSGSITDAAGNALTSTTVPSGSSNIAGGKALVIDTLAPASATSVTLSPAGGTVISNLLNTTNTNLQAAATIVAGEATGGQARLLLGTTVIATDSTILVGDTTVNFDLGLASAAALQAAIATGGSVTVILEDSAANTAAASSGVTLTVDYAVPTVTVRSSAATLKNGATATLTIATSESTTDLAVGDLSVTGGSITAFSGSGVTYTATFTPTASANATATIGVSAGAFVDANGNPSAAGSSVTITVDTVAPAAPVITGPALTSDDTPTIIGTAEANSIVAIYDGGVLIGTATTNGSGAWTFTTNTSMSGGNHPITATATDAAGNTGASNSPAFAVVIDSTPPALTLAAVAGNDEILLTEKDAGVTLSGTVENTTPAAVVEVTFAGVTRVVTISGGAWWYALTSADWSAIGTANPLTLTTVATDAAGNTSQIVRSIAINLTPLAAPGTPDLVTADDSGSSASDRLDNVTATRSVRLDVALTNSGAPTNVAGQVLELVDASGSVLVSHTLRSDEVAAGTYLFTTATLNDGTYVLRSRINDGLNSVLSAGTLTLVIDTRIPGTPGAPDLLSASDSGSSNSDSVTSNTTPTVRVAIDGVAISGSPIIATDVIVLNVGSSELMRAILTGSDISAGYVDFAITPALANGEYLLSAQAISNTSTVGPSSTTLTLTIDSSAQSAPGVPDLLAADDTGISSTDNRTSRTQPKFTVSLASGGAALNNIVQLLDGSTVIGSAVVSTADLAAGSISILPTGALGSGTYSINARIVDQAGNIGSASTSISVVVDSSTPTAPTVSLASASDTGTAGDGITSVAAIGIEGTGTAGQTINIYDGVNLLGTATVSGSGTWSYSFSAVVIDTTRRLTVTATNTAGTSSTPSGVAVVVIDVTNPLAPVVTPGRSNVLTPTVTGTAEAYTTVSVYVDGASAGIATANAAGAWSLGITVPATATYAVTARATDAAGRSSVVSSAAALVIDVTPPNAPTIAAMSTYSLTPTLTGTAEANSTVSVYDGTTLLGTASVDGSGNWSLVVSPALASSAHSFTASATDAAGNTGATSAPVTMSGVWAAIVTGADSNGANDNVSISASQFASIGITQIDTAAAAALLSDVIDGKAATAVDTSAELSNLADIVQAIMLTAAGGTPSPALTADDLAAMGITGVTSANLADILAAIAATADSGSGVSSLAALQSVATAAADAYAAKAAALAIVTAYANTDGTSSAPSLSSFTAAGVTGVDSSNLAQINSLIASLTGTQVDTAAELQAVIDAYLAVLAATDGTRNNNASLTAAEFAALGMSQIDSAVERSLLNQVLDTATSAQVDTGAELQALGASVSGIFVTAAGGTASPVLTAAGLTALGLTGVTGSNLAAILGAIAGTADDGSGVDTIAEIQALVDLIVANARVAALAIITGYNGPGSQVPTLADYENAGIVVPSGTNIDAINSVIASAAGSSKDSISEVQLILDTYNTLLSGADGDGSNNNVSLTPSQYSVLGVTSIDSTGKASLLNDVIDGKASTSVDTQAELAALASIVSRIFETAAGGTPSPALTAADLAAIGLTGVTTDNLAAVLAAIAATADNGSGVTSLAALQTVTTAAANAASAALGVISGYDGSNTVPAVADYTAAGVSGVVAGNLDSINSVIAGLSSTASDSAAEVQAVVDAYNAILNAADGTANGNSNLTAAQFQALGLAVINTNAEALLLNAIVDSGSSSGVDTLAELQNLARIVDAISVTAAGGTPSPALTAADLALLGITGVTDANLAEVLAAIAATADDGTGVNTLAKVQAIATAAAAQATAAAIAKIAAYAGSAPTPTLNDYANAGVTGVNTGNLAIINSAVAPLASSVTDSAAEIQAVVDAYAAVLAAADGADNGGGTMTAVQFQTLGLTMITSSAASTLLGSVIDSLPQTSVDTQPELAALGTTVAGIITTATGGTASPALTATELAALGITGVTTANLAYVIAAYASAGTGGLTSLADLQSVTNAAVAAALAAGLLVISLYDGSNTEPVANDFANAGVTGVTYVNLASVNSVLALVGVAESNSTLEIQSIVDAYQKVIVGADGLTNASSLLTAGDFANLNLPGIDSAAKVSLMNELIDRSTFSQVNTYSELSALADIIGAIISTSVGSSSSVLLTVSSFSAIGITGINATNLALMRAAIEATADDTSGVDTLAEIQAIATQVVATQNAALTIISNYNGANTEPLISTFTDAGIAGLNAANIDGINGFLMALGSAQRDSVAEVQALVDAFIKLLACADGIDNDNCNLTAADYHALGFTEIDTDEEVAAMNDEMDIADFQVDSTPASLMEVVADVVDRLRPVIAPREGPIESEPSPNASPSNGAIPAVTPGPSATSAPVVIPTRVPEPRPLATKEPISTTMLPNQDAPAPMATTRPISADVLASSSEGLPVYPQAPTPGNGIERPSPGEVAGVVNGIPVAVAVGRDSDDKLVLSSDSGVVFTLGVNDSTFHSASASSEDGALRILRGRTIEVAGDGLMPNSVVDVWIFSTPTHLGNVKTNGDGKFQATFELPRTVQPGDHTLKLDGVDLTGALTTITAGVQVIDVRVVDGDVQSAGDGVSASVQTETSTGALLSDTSSRTLVGSVLGFMLLLLMISTILYRRRRS